MSDREEIQAIQAERDARRWRKLMALVGSPNGLTRMRDVRLLWDVDGPDAILIVEGHQKTTARSFDAAMDLVDWPSCEES